MAVKSLWGWWREDAGQSGSLPVFRHVDSEHFAAPPIKQFPPQTRLLRRLRHAPGTVAMLAKCSESSYCLKTGRLPLCPAVFFQAANIICLLCLLFLLTIPYNTFTNMIKNH